MPMAVVVTRDVEDRYRGFLGSVMLELAPGVYAHPRLSAGVRARMIDVIADWHGRLGRGSITVCWAESNANGGLGFAAFGTPPKDVVVHDAMLLVRRALSGDMKPMAATGEAV